jgi:hypothetical protein
MARFHITLLLQITLPVTALQLPCHVNGAAHPQRPVLQARRPMLSFAEGEADDMISGVAEVQPPTGQTKQKTKQDRFVLQFVCNVCETKNTHSISRHAYNKGTVIVTCPGCNSTHLIADNLNWIEDDFRNLEEFMAKRGSPVTRVVTGGAGVTAAAEAAAQQTTPAVSRAEPSEIDKIDGITDEQALRIREAVRANKRRKSQQATDSATDVE